MSEQPALSFQGMCHYIGRLSKASKAGMKAALADCPKCHFTILEALVHTIACSGQDGAICVSDLAKEVRLAERQPDPADHRKTLVRVTPAGYAACQQCEAALGDYFTCVIARLTPEQAAQMDVLRNVLMDAILAENASREANQPKGEPNHDENL